MTETTIDEIPQKTRDVYHKALGLFERGNMDYAISLFSSCVQSDPSFLNARKYLWVARIQRFRKNRSAIGHVLALVKTAPRYLTGLLWLSAGKSAKALHCADGILDELPLDRKTATLFAHSAENLGWLDVAIQALEVAREQYPDHLPTLKHLGNLYLKTEQTKEARQLFERLGELHPKDPDVLKALKNATALESMNRDGWEEASEKGGTFRDMVKDTDEAVRLERQAKAVKSEKDTDALIQDARAKIEAEPGNINYYRTLARLYLSLKDFEQAIGLLEQAMEISPGDPELDQALSAATVQKFDHEIAQLREAGDEDGAARQAQEKAAYEFENLQARVQRYPNDLSLRFEWGKALFESNRIEEAMQEFQRAQRSPKHRQDSLYYLGLCFRHKKQYDLAIDGLTRAAAEIESMTPMKKAIVYELGEVHELAGQPDEAARLFKQIYQVDIGYRDIRAKVEGSYTQ